MKNIFIILIFIASLNFCNSQNIIFLPSEDGWVTIVEFSDWIEDNPENYLGAYKFYYIPYDNYGNYVGGDGYSEEVYLQKIDGKLVAISTLDIEGWDETQKDTLHNVSIAKNYLNTNRPNLKFVTLSYKDKKNKLKKKKGILDFDGEKTDYFLEKNKNSAQGKEEKSKGMFDDISKKISELLPSGAYLREYEKLTDVNEETYIGIYVTNFKDPLVPVIPQDQFDPDNWFVTCPEMTQGQSLTGKYFLFAYTNNKIISQVPIPANVYDSKDECSISLYNTPYNNCWYFSYPSENCAGYSENSLEKTKLIQLLDLTGDKKKNEFMLTGMEEGCGFIDRLCCGFNVEDNEVSVYPIAGHTEKYYWFPRFFPTDGECSVEIICGDHGYEEYHRSDYKFNRSTKQYDLVYEVTEECN